MGEVFRVWDVIVLGFRGSGCRLQDLGFRV